MANRPYSGKKLARIYGLADPETLEIRYIGKTVNSLKNRLKQHIKHAKNTTNSKKSTWIESIGWSPEIVLLEEGLWTHEELNAKEVSWISSLEELRGDLLNLTPGGDGGYNDGLHAWNTRAWTDEERAAHSEKMKKWHQERKDAGLPDCLGDETSRKRRQESRKKWLESGGRAVLSKSIKDAWADPEKGKILYETTQDPVRNSKIAESTKKRYEDPEERRRTGDSVKAAMTEEGKQRISKATLKRHGYSEPMTEIPCSWCDKLFLPNRRTKKTCSEECRRSLSSKNRRDTIERKKNVG